MATVELDRDVPVLDLDPFSDAFLSDPFTMHRELRAAGPVFKLSRYNIWGVARHAEVEHVLRDHTTFCSGRGAGLSDFAKEKPWRPPSIILEADPPQHTKSRTVLARVLSPGAMRKLRDTFEAEAEALADRLVAMGEFDAVTDLGEVYPPKVFPDAVGIDEDGRENLIPYGSMAFNAFGPRNKRLEDALAAAPPIVAWIMSKCDRKALKPGGFGMQIFEAADTGEITEAEAGMLVRSLLTAGVDTTVNGIGNLVNCFLDFPDQWDVLRSDIKLARNAFEESLRYESTVQTFFRTTTAPGTLGGVTIPADEKVLCFLSAANRDERRWEKPDSFDIRRSVVGHAGFGIGIHGCVGQMVARLEGELVLAALAKRIKRIERAGEPVLRLNNTLHCYASIPVRVTAG